MYFKQMLNDACGCCSYFIASRDSKEAVVVDPAFDVQPYLDLARERGYTIKYVIDTHLHADHVSGNRRLAAATNAQVCLHQSAEVAFPFRRLADGDELLVGQLILRIMHTPGHRPESISVLVTNPPRSPVPSMVLTGDTLFVGDVGRPDFGGPSGAEQQYRSVHRLFNLEDFVEVFPAHFEGSCGKGMCGRPSTTIGFERRFNPWAQLEETEFVERAAEMPARPLNMTAILRMNSGQADYDSLAMSCAAAEVPSMTVEQAADWLRAECPFVLDVREPTEYGSAHMPGASSVPQADLALRLDEIPRDRDVLVVCASGARSLNAARFLRGLGYERITNLAGGTNDWVRAGYPVKSQAVPSAA